MTKKTFIKIFSIFAMLFFAEGAFAATINFAPTSVTTEVGQSFTLQSYVNPQSLTVYTTKLELRYPADMLQVNSFSFSSGWMPLTQTGYNIIDNNSGILVKTGGYPYPGINSNTSFGIISFTAKKSGIAYISVGPNTVILDGNNNNALSSIPVIAVANIKPVVVVTPTQPTVTTPRVTVESQPQQEVNSSSVPEVTTPTETIDTNQSGETQTPIEEAASSAALTNFFNFSNWNPLVMVIIIIIILLLVVYGGYLIMKR